MENIERFFSKDDWYKDDYFWRRPNADGSNGKGDLIYNTCGKIAYDGEDSEWVRKSLQKCFTLLWAHKRWPDWDVHRMDAKSWFWRVVNRIINKSTRFVDKILGTKIRTHLPFRAQGRMSRDPYIAFFAACTALGEYRKIELLTPVWYIYRPNFAMWRRFLISGNLKHLGLFYILDSQKPHNKEYVRRLGEWRAFAIENKLKKLAK